MQAIDPFVANPDFEAKQIEKASKACTAICLWVRAMHKYNLVAKQVEPKRKLLAEKQASHHGINPHGDHDRSGDAAGGGASARGNVS